MLSPGPMILATSPFKIALLTLLGREEQKSPAMRSSSHQPAKHMDRDSIRYQNQRTNVKHRALLTNERKILDFPVYHKNVHSPTPFSDYPEQKGKSASSLMLLKSHSWPSVEKDASNCAVLSLQIHTVKRVYSIRGLNEAFVFWQDNIGLDCRMIFIIFYRHLHFFIHTTAISYCNNFSLNHSFTKCCHRMIFVIL